MNKDQGRWTSNTRKAAHPLISSAKELSSREIAAAKTQPQPSANTPTHNQKIAGVLRMICSHSASRGQTFYLR